MKTCFKTLLLVFFSLTVGSFCYAYSSNTTTYWCDGGCGGEIVYQSCHSSQSSCCSSSSDSDSDSDSEGEESSCTPGEMVTTCGNVIKTGIKAESWQTCVGSQYKTSGTDCGDSWESEGGSKFYFLCSGSCLNNVTGVRFYENPNYPQKPELTISGSEEYPETCSEEDLKTYPLNKNCIEPAQSTNSVKMPFKIDWDEDPYFMKTGKAPSQFVGNLRTNTEYEEMASLGPLSYTIKMGVSLENTNFSEDQEFSEYLSKNLEGDQKEINKGYFYKILNVDTQPNYIDSSGYRSSEYNFRVDHNACWLKSNEDYSLTVQTCCRSDGTNCNSGKVVNFRTSYAPELKSPEDLDWSGPNTSAWNAWGNLTLEDYGFDEEKRITSVPTEKFNPFDWETESPQSYESEKIDFPIFLDWCDVEEINGGNKKYAWTMKLFQFILNDDKKEEEVLHPGLANGEIRLSVEAASSGVNWTHILFSNYFDERTDSYFTENEKYSWEIRSCLADSCVDDFGEHWSFETKDSDLGADFKIITKDGSILGIPAKIEWNLSKKVNSVLYKIPNVSEGKTNQSWVDFNNLQLNTSYSISVTPCSDYDSEKCEPENTKSITFKTTGMPPIVNDLEEKVYIPFKISWQEVPGALSYKYSLNGVEEVVQGIEKIIGSEQSQTDTSYSLKVKTCADKEGLNCGSYSETKTFRTETLLGVESISTDETEGILYTNNRQVSWDSVEEVNYYKYGLYYVGDDSREDCQEIVGEQIAGDITSSTSFFVSSLCTGRYNLSIATCQDKECDDSGGVENFSFNLESKKEPTGSSSGGTNFLGGGLVPCNREYDDPKTAWDETLSCNINHFFLMIRIIFDFMLIRFLPAVFVLTLLYNGGLFLLFKFIYFDRSRMDLIQKTKDIWRMFAIGFSIIFLAWTVINLFLLFFDPEMSTFGSWSDPLN